MNLLNVSKFSYLKKIFVPIKYQSRLPFNSEGYGRVKNILRKIDKYGKPNEIVKTDTKRIIQLPLVFGTKSSKVYNFHEKPAHIIQKLDTVGRSEGITRYMQMTLYKIPLVKRSLMMLDKGGKEWHFGNLVNARKLWKERKPSNSEINLNPWDMKEQSFWTSTTTSFKFSRKKRS